MKRTLLTLVLITGTAMAQRYNPDRRYGAPPSGEVFERAQVDLSRAAQHSYDRRRIERAQREIANFQRKLSYGRFSSHDLDKAIGATDGVAKSGSIPPPDRNLLFRDVEDMRAFRAYAH